MVTKYKAAVFIIAAMFSSIASAAYTTMTIEGVKQANGVWTAAGVIDNMGFVKSTGTITVAGVSTSTAVSMPINRSLASNAVKGASRLMGPAALALAAYDIYSYYESYGMTGTEEWQFKDPNNIYGTCTTFGNQGVLSLSECIALAKTKYPQYSQYPVVTCVTPPSTNINFYTSSCTYGANNRYNIGMLGSPKIVPVPATDAHFNGIPELTLPLIISGYSKLPALNGQGVPISGTSFTPYSSWYGDPYFKDGNWWRDRMDVSPAPTKQEPTRVKVDIGPVKIEGATNPETVPDTGPAGGTGGAPQPEKEKPTFCEANPMSIACAEMGELKDEKLEVEERPVDVSYTPWGSSTSQCPADKVIPLWDDQSITISYSPVCQFASLLRPLVIALAFVAAGFIVAGITRKGAES